MRPTRWVPYASLALLAWVGSVDAWFGGPSLSPFLLGIAAIHWLLTRARREPARLRRATLFLVGAFVVAFGTGTMQYVQTRHNKELASTLVRPLEAYCAAHHALPGSLEALVPRYIPAIPHVREGLGERTIWFHPSQEAPCAYMLVIPGATFPVFGHWYDSRDGQWRARFD